MQIAGISPWRIVASTWLLQVRHTDWGLRSYDTGPNKHAELGAERLHDCLGWATGQPCGECYVCHTVAWAREIKRVLRDDGTFWLNLGDSYFSDTKGTGGPSEKQTSNAGSRYEPKKFERTSGIKPKDLVGIPWLVAFALRADGWYLRSDVIWCLSHSTRVYARTQKGEMPMTVGEMVRLNPETVGLWTGEKWARVRGFSQSPETEGIEIELRSGQRISCTPGHVWPTERGNVRADELRIGDKLIRVALPEPQLPKMPASIPDRFGWVMGFYLAEGSAAKGDGLQFSMHSEENAEADRLREFAEYYGSAFTVFDYGNSRQVHILGGIAGSVVREYITGGDCKHKHLTTAAWQRSNEFIRMLLAGYLDGDGHHDEQNNRWRLGFARNDALADDLRTICARLGVSIRLKRAWHKNQSGKFYGWVGEVRFGNERRTSDTEVVGLQKSKSERFFDIGIEEPHVFALSSGVLTHNSKPNPMPESVTDRPTKSHEYIFLLTKSARYFYDAEAIREVAAYDGRKDTVMKGSDKYENGFVPNQSPHTLLHARGHERWQWQDGVALRNRRTVWSIPTSPYPGSHFATWPPRLVEPMIKAGTSERGVCPACGSPWERVVETKTRYDHVTTKDGKSKIGPYAAQTGGGAGTHDIRHGVFCDTQTLGWRPTCSCPEAPPVPAIVLDPFAGSGTTLMVARSLGRSAIGLDLSEKYLHECARERLGLNALTEWEQGRVVETQVDDLPMFRKETT